MQSFQIGHYYHKKASPINSGLSFLNPLMHNVYKVVTLPKNSFYHLVLLLKYLRKCDHFVYIMH